MGEVEVDTVGGGDGGGGGRGGLGPLWRRAGGIGGFGISAVVIALSATRLILLFSAFNLQRLTYGYLCTVL